MIINMVGGGGGFSPSNAILGVTAYSGSVVTISNGTVAKTVTADRSHPLENDNLHSIYYFGISPSLFSSSVPWDIQAEYNSDIVYADVTINDNSFYNVVMNYVIPYEYQQVTYLKGTGIQYIDSLIECRDIKKINTQFMMENSTRTADWAPSIFGACNNQIAYNFDTTNGFSLFTYWDTTNFLFGINNWNYMEWAAGSSGSLGIIDYDNIMNFELDTLGANKFCKLQGNLPSIYYTYIDDSMWAQVNIARSLYLFAKHCTDGADVVSSGQNINRIYTFEMYNSQNEKISNLIPCYRKSDSVAGMYDNINNRFLTNQGTGTFTVGSDVT